jgi:hypothetical protein
MKRKNIISLMIAFAFLALSITGILLYIKQKSHAAEITHTLFGLLFVGFAVFHILNNWGSIKSYSKDRSTSKFQKEFFVAAGIFSVILIGGVTEFLEPVAEAGKLFAGKRQERPKMLSFESVSTNKESKGRELEIMVEKQNDVALPAIAIWVESTDGKFAELLLAPEKIFNIPADIKDVREAFEEGKVKESMFSEEQFTGLKGSGTKFNVEKLPNENLRLNSKTNIAAPYILKMQVLASGKSEIYEAKIETAETGVAEFKGTGNQLIKSAIIDLK